MTFPLLPLLTSALDHLECLRNFCLFPEILKRQHIVHWHSVVNTLLSQLRWWGVTPFKKTCLPWRAPRAHFHFITHHVSTLEFTTPFLEQRSWQFCRNCPWRAPTCRGPLPHILGPLPHILKKSLLVLFSYIKSLCRGLSRNRRQQASLPLSLSLSLSLSLALTQWEFRV